MRIDRSLIVVAGMALLASAAHADLKMVQNTTIDSPQMKAALQSMPAQQKAMMAKMGMGGTLVTTTYVSGKKIRTDMGSLSRVIDTAGHKITTINRQAHTYSSSTYNPPQGASQMKASVKDTGQTRTILGHPARHYTLSISGVTPQGGQVRGDIWAAQDLPQPPVTVLSQGPMAALRTEMKKIKGMPLLTTMVVSGSPMGRMTIKNAVKSVSTAPLSAAVFAVPKGYKPAPAETGMGGAPMGGMGGLKH